jgi:hypothetical protein
MSLFDLLVIYQQISQYVEIYWEILKEAIRRYVGPSPNTTYLIFDNHDVIPAGKEHCKYVHIAYYSPAENRIYAKDSTAAFKRLPYASIQHCIGEHVVDLSDWVSELRTNTSVSLLALLRAASHSLNIHLPETDRAKVLVITTNGEEEEYKYHGTLSLVKHISIEDVGVQNAEGPLFF